METHMKRKFNKRKAALHLLMWVAAFFISTILIQGYSLRINWTNTLVSWAIYLFIFYINYLVLIPLLRRWKWIPLYVILALGTLTGSFYCIKYTAIETARKTTAELQDQLRQYTEIEKSYDDKERIREHQRDSERQREREKARVAGKSSPDEALPPPPDGLPEEFRPRRPRPLFVLPDSMEADSLTRAVWLRERDSLLAVIVTFTPEEEEYGVLRRAYDQSRGYLRWLLRGNDNPLERHNLQFVFALIFFYMASIMVFFVEQTGKAEKHRQRMEQEKTRAELAYLKQQINPHFLFNTLNSIYSYTIGVSEEASDAVLKLSSILRYMLYETNRDRVPLIDELAVIDNYIDLQRLRTTEKTEIRVFVEGDTHLHRIEPMLLIPIIENAFKYGVDSVEPSFVQIDMKVQGSDFTFSVSNRIVRRNEGDRSHSGIGLKNIRRRLELIYGAGNYAMNVQEKNGIFSVTLRLNLKD
jgi:hypothetical protein